jgi:hypothetical protein
MGLGALVFRKEMIHEDSPNGSGTTNASLIKNPVIIALLQLVYNEHFAIACFLDGTTQSKAIICSS